MQELDGVLRNATAALGELYFRLPIEAGEARLFVRNYCYELYHQMRCLWPADCPYSLNGEIDKRWHPVIRELGETQVILDLLAHTPGSMEGNHAIIEVKRASTDARGIRTDLTTLIRFMRPDIHYVRDIYLIFGGVDMDMLRDVAKTALTPIVGSRSVDRIMPGKLPTAQHSAHPRRALPCPPSSPAGTVGGSRGPPLAHGRFSPAHPLRRSENRAYASPVP